ncbi:hypothetical protein K461DRAFT_264864 [Myriangium duriaei CBS 260.36]|uniref:Uncharacterized protein n=1 Tax=Myriangium duriaei CBS 260.36 TaxID=1168546 RepID=A0A9P4JA24_9PEZI|nr:hypothetical protein K461DRAFT_264864 [Myriangium duriaei CBS 260.36]
MAPIKRPTMSTPRDSFQELIDQSEHQVKSWAGFSTSTISNMYERPAQQQHYFYQPGSPNRTPRDQPDFLNVGQDQTSRTAGAITPPIPDRAPGRPNLKSTSPRRLKRKPTPRFVSLRELRAQQSEAALRSMYESQTDAYLNDILHPHHDKEHSRRSTKWSLSDSSGEEDIKEEPEE